MNSSWRRVAVCGSACVLILCSVTSETIAAVFGQNPFVNVINTPPSTITSNSNIGPGPAFDKSMHSTIFTGPLPAPALFYQETWTTSRDVETVFLDTDRQASGDIYVATSSGGPVTTHVASFSNASFSGNTHHIRQTGIFGVRVEVSSTTSNHYQLSEIEFDSIHLAHNLAIGATSIASPGSTFGNVADQGYAGIGTSEWRASSSDTVNGGEQWTGWEFAPGVSKLARGVRVVGAAPHAGIFFWRDWDLQIKQGGIWTLVGRANIPSNQSIHWVDFGTPTLIEGVRLFGSTAGGNNPTASGGLIIDDIYAFLPEPGSTMILAIAGVILMKRRARNA